MNNYTRTNISLNALPVSLCNTSIGPLYDSNCAPKKLVSSLRVLRAPLPDPMFMKASHMEDARAKKAAKSFCSLDQLLHEAHKVSASAAVTCSSTPKLNQHHWKPENRNTSMKNAVFDVHQTSRRRRPLRTRKGCSNRLMRNELLLDDCSSLIRRMEEYQRQKKNRTFTSRFDTDSDEEDLE